MILLDTNVLSEFMRPTPNGRVRDWLNQHPASTLFISSISRAEISFGIELLPEGKRKSLFTQAAQDIFYLFADRSLPFGDLASNEYGKIMATRRQIGRPIDTIDAQIAAIALAHNLKLATRNTKDFADIPQLQLIDPWQNKR